MASIKNRKICRFLTDEKTTKRVVEAAASNSIFLPESSYPRLEGVAVLAKLAQATTRRAEALCDWKLRARRHKASAV
ncbi:MAG: hypothetical protein KH382_09895 [Clostridiales bacterium]|nr:hypothetical protein [Clostridiales bacterium]